MTPTMLHLFVETILNKCSDIADLRIFDNIKSPNALERVLYTNIPILCKNSQYREIKLTPFLVGYPHISRCECKRIILQT